MTKPISLGFLVGSTYKPLIKSLSLNFLAGTTLDSRVTFSRGTNATLVDSTGKLTYAPNNLVLRSEEFDNASWGKGATTVTGSATTAPNGTLTAEKIIPTAVSTEHYVRQTLAIPTGSSVTVSAYVKASGYSSIRLRCLDNSLPANGFLGSVDTSTGVTSGAIAGAGTFRSVSATNVGDGWWRLSVTGNTGATTTLVIFDIFVLSGNQASATLFTGDATSGVFLWGAQFEVVTYQTLPSTYVQTVASAYYGPRFNYNPATLAPRGLLIEEQRINLMTYSNGITGWSPSPAGCVTATANAAVSPDGTSNATKLATGDTLSNGHAWFKTYSGAVSTTYTGSVYLKAGEYTRAQVEFGNSAFAATYGVLVNLSNGTIVATSAGATATISNAGNGWYRCTVTATSDADGGNYVFAVSPKPASVTTIDAIYTSASVGLGVFVYGLQVETGAFATSHLPTVASTVTRSADIATMAGTNFSSWYNQSEGTIVASVDTVVPTGSPPVLSFQGAPTSSLNRHQITVTTAFTATVDSSVTQSNIGTNTNLSPKLAYAYKANDFAACANGAAVSTDTSGTVPLTLAYATLGKFDFGSAASLNGHLRSIDYYPVRWADAQLPSLTV